MKVLKWYHGGRDPMHRERDRALSRAGVDLVSVIPTSWPGPDDVHDEPFTLIELPVVRAGDVNRHRLARPDAFAELVRRERPDVVDLCAEPFSRVTRQLLRVLPVGQPVIAYTAQNLDKRFPPPFAQWEAAALGRVQGLYPCSRQAASVAVGKGFAGALRVLPLAPPDAFAAGEQHLPGPLRMLLVGRLEPYKGVLDAVRVLAGVHAATGARLVVAGSGPDAGPARRLAEHLGVGNALEILPWSGPDELARQYRAAHVVLAPSRATATWVEQFGRMVVEAQVSGAVVLAYASGALPDVVAGAGVLVAEGDVGALTREVLALWDDPVRWTVLRERGLAAAPTWDAVAADQVALLDEAATALERPRRVRPNRSAARDRFGPPAQVAGAPRPFALPVLRHDTAGSRTLARGLDRVARRERGVRAACGTGRVRVVYLDHVAQLSGGEIALARLIAALPDVDAHVILAEAGPLRERLEQLGAHVEILPLAAVGRHLSRESLAGPATLLALCVYTVRLARRLRELEPDVVHTNSLKSGYYGSVAARLAGVPVLWHVRDRLAEDYLPRRAVRLTRTLLRHLPDLVVCNSAETASLAGTPSRVIPDPYRPSRPPVEHRDGPLTVGMVGRIAPWKGHDVLVRSVARLVATRPDLQVRICGSAMFGADEWLRELTQLVAELNLGTHVTFAGFCSDIEAELATFDVLVHASRIPEPFGQVVVEGMAAGLAVIATDGGGPAEIIEDSVDGLLVAFEDPVALADAIESVAGLARRRELGRAAVARARDFDPAAIGPRFESAYRSMLGDDGGRTPTEVPKRG